jgi:hypothetical protein
MTREQAIALVETKWWEGKTHRQIAMFQLFEDRLCMPFDKFHEAVEKALGRPVYTHEFGSAGNDGLRKELMGEKPAPTLDEIIEMIPEAKRILIQR